MTRTSKLLLLCLTTTSIISGCSSTPRVAESAPYCTTEERIVVKNGETVNSKTIVECTDDQIKRLFHTKSGMSPYCGTFTYWGRKGGHDVQRKGVTCQKPDGSWEIVNTNIR